MKYNIKLVLKNKNIGLKAGHTLPTLLFNNFFSHRTKILKFYYQPTLVHLPLPPARQSNSWTKSKEPILPMLNREYKLNLETKLYITNR